MPRNMSFSMTTEAVRNRTKTVTRRLAWWDLKPGDVLMAVEKGMGLKKGEKVQRLGLIRVVSVRMEDLHDLTDERIYSPTQASLEMRREGFPEWSPLEFVLMFIEGNNLSREYGSSPFVNRIEFEYVEEAPSE